MSGYQIHQPRGGLPIKAWTRGVPVEGAALAQLENVAQLPFVHGWVAAMPDVHVGIGATVGSVIPTLGAVIPAAVGVDIGCGMMAVQTTLRAADLPDHLGQVRAAVERAVPHGRTPGGRDRGAWGNVPERVGKVWQQLQAPFFALADKHPSLKNSNHVVHLGTLGTGNHFIELCLDEQDQLWVMLHSGSRGVGNRIGNYFIELAKKDMARHAGQVPDVDLAYLQEGSEHFDDYLSAVLFAQDFAAHNRRLMMDAVIDALRQVPQMPTFGLTQHAVNCHHNYVSHEHHYGRDVLVTRKGAVHAGQGVLGIIPGSMGAKSYIVRGKGNPESFCSCSHGAGRVMSRTQAKKVFSLEDHRKATAGVECRKDKDVLDETPGAYKNIEAVMRAQEDLVEIVHTLKQIVCVKG